MGVGPSARTRGRTLRCGRQGMSPAPPPPPACSNKGGRGRASSHLSIFLLLTSVLSALLLPPVSAKDVFTNHFLVHLDPSHGHPDPPALARDIAKRNGFHSLGPLLNSPHEFHFVQSSGSSILARSSQSSGFLASGSLIIFGGKKSQSSSKVPFWALSLSIKTS